MGWGKLMGLGRRISSGYYYGYCRRYSWGIARYLYSSEEKVVQIEKGDPALLFVRSNSPNTTWAKETS